MKQNKTNELIENKAVPYIISTVKQLEITKLGSAECASLLDKVALAIGDLSLNLENLEESNLDLRHERFEVVRILHKNVRAFIDRRKDGITDENIYIEPRLAKELSSISITRLSKKEKSDRGFVAAINEMHKHLCSIAMDEYRRHLKRR